MSGSTSQRKLLANRLQQQLGLPYDQALTLVIDAAARGRLPRTLDGPGLDLAFKILLATPVDRVPAASADLVGLGFGEYITWDELAAHATIATSDVPAAAAEVARQLASQGLDGLVVAPPDAAAPAGCGFVTFDPDVSGPLVVPPARTSDLGAFAAGYVDGHRQAVAKLAVARVLERFAPPLSADELAGHLDTFAADHEDAAKDLSMAAATLAGHLRGLPLAVADDRAARPDRLWVASDPTTVSAALYEADHFAPSRSESDRPGRFVVVAAPADPRAVAATLTAGSDTGTAVVYVSSGPPPAWLASYFGTTVI